MPNPSATTKAEPGNRHTRAKAEKRGEQHERTGGGRSGDHPHDPSRV